MHITVFSTKPYDRSFLEEGNVTTGHSLSFLEARLSATTCGLAKGADTLCVFVNDEVNAEVLASLASMGVKLVALRAAASSATISLRDC